MLDGRHTGTGGGNHIVLGGTDAGRQPVPAPAGSARERHRLLAEPSRRCPTCSPGLFVGPTSQAPRVDEARHEALYELEIALAQVPRARRRRTAAVAGRPPVPQSAGRRHRQHPPRRDLHRQALLARGADGPARPGRVPRVRDAAARAHEPRPAAAAARARRRFWERPYRAQARALGHRAARPLHAAALRVGGLLDVIDDLTAAAASRSSPTGSRPTSSSAFRAAARSNATASSSSCARRSSRGTCSARRRTAGGTARYVDSSLERVQVKVEGSPATAMS